MFSNPYRLSFTNFIIYQLECEIAVSGKKLLLPVFDLVSSYIFWPCYKLKLSLKSLTTRIAKHCYEYESFKKTLSRKKNIIHLRRVRIVLYNIFLKLIHWTFSTCIHHFYSPLTSISGTLYCKTSFAGLFAHPYCRLMSLDLLPTFSHYS